MTFLAKVYIKVRPTVSDPQGHTIHQALRQLGFDGVDGVRAGKYMEIRLTETDPDAAAVKVREMCETLLANPVIEDYEYEVLGIDEE